MLTLKQINEISFRKSSFSGYRPEDVDNFIDEVVESFTALAKENQLYKSKATELAAKNAEMREKLVVLAEKVETYREDEDGIKDALLSAQRLGAASIKEAKKKADAILADATAKANELIDGAKIKSAEIISACDAKITAKEKELDSLKAAVTSFRASLYDMYREHLSIIEKLPDYSAEVKVEEKVEEIVKEESAEQEVVQPEPAVQPEIDEIESYVPEVVNEIEDIPEFKIEEPVKVSDTKAFEGIDLNAYADIPESLRKEKASLCSTLEFGDDIDIKK